VASNTEEGRESLGPERYKDQNRTEWNGEVKGAKKLVIYSTPWINIAARNNTKDSQFPARFSIWDTFPQQRKAYIPSFFFRLCLWWSTSQREAGRFININSRAEEPFKGACLFVESFSFKTQLPSHTQPKVLQLLRNNQRPVSSDCRNHLFTFCITSHLPQGGPLCCHPWLPQPFEWWVLGHHVLAYLIILAIQSLGGLCLLEFPICSFFVVFGTEG